MSQKDVWQRESLSVGWHTKANPNKFLEQGFSALALLTILEEYYFNVRDSPVHWGIFNRFSRLYSLDIITFISSSTKMGQPKLSLDIANCFSGGLKAPQIEKLYSREKMSLPWPPKSSIPTRVSVLGLGPSWFSPTKGLTPSKFH